MNACWKKVLSVFLSLTLLLSAMHITGLPVKADTPLIAEGEEITLSASLAGIEVEFEIGQNIIETLNEIKDQSNICEASYEDCHFMFYLDKTKTATEESFDFEIYPDDEWESYILRRGYDWSVNAFSATLYCAAGYYSQITIETYCDVNFDMGCNAEEMPYYSKGYDGESYTLADEHYPETLFVPYGGTLTQSLDGAFKQLPEIVNGEHVPGGWYIMDEMNEDPQHPDASLKVDPASTVFTYESYYLYMLWDPDFEEHEHMYPASTDEPNDNVVWHWNGTASTNFSGTYVDIFCTDTECPDRDGSKITIRDNVEISHETDDGTCTTAGKIIYYAIAAFDEEEKEYSTMKEIAGTTISGHTWVLDQNAANAAWTGSDESGYTKVTVNKICTNPLHDEEKDGPASVPLTVSVTKTDVPVACGNAAQTKYTGVFDSTVDAALTQSYTFEKVVNGPVKEHSWTFDTDATHVVWTGSFEAGYTSATITKTCQDPLHSGAKTVNVSAAATLSAETAACGTKSTKTYKAVFDSSVDPAITESFIFEKTVEGAVLEHTWSVDTEHVEWVGNDTDGYTQVKVTKTCTNPLHNESVSGPKTVTLTASVSKETEIVACEKPVVIHYTATFHSETDPVFTEPFTASKDVNGPVHQHDWTFDFHEENVVWTGSDEAGYTTATIYKMCRSIYHDADVSGSKKVPIIATVSAETTEATCTEDGTATYTATFNSTLDAGITEPFTVTKTVKTEATGHQWAVDTSSENVVWTAAEGGGYTTVSVTKSCNNPLHNAEKDGQKTVTLTAEAEKETEIFACEKPTVIHYTATFDEDVDEVFTEPFTATKDEEGPVHEHEWFFDTDEKNVEWTGNDTDGYTTVTIHKICMSEYHDEDISGAQDITITANVTSGKTKVTCTKGAGITYSATFDSTLDADIKEPFTVEKNVGEPASGHQWVVDSSEKNLTWTGSDEDGYTAASVTKTCTNPLHDEKSDGPKTVAVTVTLTTTENTPKCGEKQLTYYTATFNSTVDPAIEKEVTYTKTVEGEVLQHDWSVTKIDSNGSFTEAPTTVTLTIVCTRDATETEVVVPTTIDYIGGSSESEKTYRYTGTASDGQKITAEESFYNHTEHKWTVVFEWKQISTNIADTKVLAEATCANGGEKIPLEVDLKDKYVSGGKIEYTATATDPSGAVWKEKKNIDQNTGVTKDGDAGIPSYQGSDIRIVGLEESYPYTGSKLKPPITVWDGDVQLAASTDYTVSYTGKNKIGETNTVNVRGKGNYQGKSVDAKFTITDPRVDVDAEALTKEIIKKIEISQKEFTYNGLPQMPEVVTVTLKNKTVIEYKLNANGKYDTDSSVKVAISVCNNVGKGTATIAATNADGKNKKKTYKIKQADLASATFEVEAAEWGVKTAIPVVKATYNDQTIVMGMDFKGSFKAANAGEGLGVAKFSGKGNFKGKQEVKYNVTPLEIKEENVIVTAVAGNKLSNVKVAVVDSAGNAINKKHFSTTIRNGETGNEINNKKEPLPDSIIVKVKAGSGNLSAPEEGVEVEVHPKTNIAKVKKIFKVNSKYTKTYTGEPVLLDEEDFGNSDKIDSQGLVLNTDFVIVSYKNNVKKGTMTVTVQGIGEYSGTKTFKVKIVAKPIGFAK